MAYKSVLYATAELTLATCCGHGMLVYSDSYESKEKKWRWLSSIFRDKVIEFFGDELWPHFEMGKFSKDDKLRFSHPQDYPNSNRYDRFLCVDYTNRVIRTVVKEAILKDIMGAIAILDEVINKDPGTWLRNAAGRARKELIGFMDGTSNMDQVCSFCVGDDGIIISKVPLEDSRRLNLHPDWDKK